MEKKYNIVAKFIKDMSVETKDANTFIFAKDNIVIPVGPTSKRGGYTTGSMRYNTDDGNFEGYDGNNWGSLGGVKDTDGDTFIQAQLPDGTDTDTLKLSENLKKYLLAKSECPFWNN